MTDNVILGPSDNYTPRGKGATDSDQHPMHACVGLTGREEMVSLTCRPSCALTRATLHERMQMTSAPPQTTRRGICHGSGQLLQSLPCLGSCCSLSWLDTPSPPCSPATTSGIPTYPPSPRVKVAAAPARSGTGVAKPAHRRGTTRAGQMELVRPMALASGAAASLGKGLSEQLGQGADRLARTYILIPAGPPGRHVH